jgi:hypothetical protein
MSWFKVAEVSKCKGCGSQAVLNKNGLCKTCEGKDTTDAVKRLMQSNWTKVAVVLLLVSFSGCSTQRVLVRDCQDMKDSPFKNCELIQKL